MAIQKRYTSPQYNSYGKEELEVGAVVNCAKGSVGATCKGNATGVICSTSTGIRCSGVGGIGVSCDSEQTGAVCASGVTAFVCENSAQSSPKENDDDDKT